MAKNGHWWLHIWVKGHYAGADEFRSWTDATLAKQEREPLTKLGCHYEIHPHAHEPE